MKISRLHIDQFARDDFPEFSRNNIAGDDLLVVGGNRSGKTLTFNALLYALYGPRATYNVSPGRKSEVQITFDNCDELTRGSRGRKYRTDDNTFEKNEADEAIAEHVGEEDIVIHQFIPSETSKLPLSSLSQEERISLIRQVMDSSIERKIEQLKEQRDKLDKKIEHTERVELKPQQNELNKINISQYKSRLKKIEQIQSLIESDRIKAIKQRLIENEDLRNELENLDDRRQSLSQELRRKKRKLRKKRRYTRKVDKIIIDAISELVCPVCDQVVPEETAKGRLRDSRCPQCGRKRSLEELKQNLRSKVDSADDEVETLEKEVEKLQQEKEEIQNKISSLRSSTPDISDLNDLAIHTLKKNNYDIDAVKQETQEELEKYRSTISDQQDQKEQLENRIEEIKKQLDALKRERKDAAKKIKNLSQESFQEIVTDFRSQWSENYQAMAPDLAVDINLQSDGEIILPGSDGPRRYDELSTGEVRLLNISFVYTLTQQANDGEDVNHNLKCIVMDEPFANVDDDLQNSTLEILRSSEVQFIITTSNEDMTNKFDQGQINRLNRMHIQYKLDETEELIDD